MRKLLILYLLGVMSCAATNRSGGLYEDPLQNFSIIIPQGWEQVNLEKDLLITKDGPFSQYILVQDFKLDKNFNHTQKRFQKNMLPQEASAVIIDEISSDKTIKNFELQENVQLTVNKHDGFRLVFTYNTADGISHKTVYYGFLDGDIFYAIRYNTCNESNYQKDADSLQEVLNSFQVLHAGAM
ncbi:MAG TPA: hypothetical protein VEI04_10575 [Syntrophobacteria bacterium]|nr:hypothetical protein [Syntrophobacteria bacterium]